MRWLKILSFGLVFSLSLCLKAEEVQRLLETLQREKSSVTHGGKATHKLRWLLMNDETALEGCANEKSLVILLDVFEFIDGAKRSDPKALKYKSDSLWILGYLYEKKPKTRGFMREKASFGTLASLLNFFQKKDSKGFFPLKNDLVRTLKNKYELYIGEESLNLRKVLPDFVKVLASSLEERNKEARTLALSLITWFIKLVRQHNKMADPLVEAGVTRGISGAHTHPERTIRDMSKTLLEDLQGRTSDSVSEKDQERTDRKRFWDNLAISFGLKEKKPHRVQINLGPLEKAERSLSKKKS